MIKMLTAIGSPELNEELKKEIEIEYKDIQYKEGILEILEKDNKINLIIINEKLPGKIEINLLIEKILKINSKIKIYLITENKKNINKKENIYFFEKNKINYKEIKEKIIYENFKNINKKEILEENKKNFNYYEKKQKNIFSKKCLKKETPQKGTKYIYILGPKGIGKTVFATILALCLSKEKNRVLLVDMDSKNGNIHTIFQVKKYIDKIQKIKNNLDFICCEKEIIKNNNNYDFILIDNYKNNYNEIINKNYKIIFLFESNLIGIEKCKKILFELNNKNLKNIILLFNYYNKNSIDEKIIKNIFFEIKIIKKIKYDENFNLLINNFNKFYLNIIFEKKYKKIFNFLK